MNMSSQVFNARRQRHHLLPIVVSLTALLLSGCNDILIREAVIEMKTPAPGKSKGMSWPDQAGDPILYYSQREEKRWKKKNRGF